MNAANADWKAYLDWQAEMGTEEVILAAPLIRSATLAGAAGTAHAGRPETRGGPRSAPPLHSAPFHPDEEASPSPASPSSSSSYKAPPAIGPDFFNAIAEKLAKPDLRGDARARGKTNAAGSATASPAPAAASQAAGLPEFADAGAYWNWLENEYPKWFPAASGVLTRAVGHSSPRLAVVELSPSADGLFAGEAGVLLDKMMHAIGLRREDLYLTAVMKTPPPGRSWARKDVARMLPALFRELKLADCGLVLVLGETCAQAVLRTGRGIPALTGTAETAAEAEGLSLSATWHPADLLADETRKKPAWEHLKWLQTRLPKRGS